MMSEEKEDPTVVPSGVVLNVSRRNAGARLVIPFQGRSLGEVSYELLS